MSDSQIHVVMGSTGEYSDHQEWSVAAYFSKSKAEEHVVKASARARELIAEKGEFGSFKGGNEFDAEMQVDYTGVNYYVMTVPILDIPESLNLIEIRQPK